MKTNYSFTKRTFRVIYDKICGVPPSENVLHCRYGTTHNLYNEYERYLSKLNGTILDLGCGEKPFIKYFKKDIDYIGVDIDPKSSADFIVKPIDRLPFVNNTFDAVISLQVIEHVENLEFFNDEIKRVLKKDGTLVISVPFLYNVHGLPNDFRRFTLEGLKKLYINDFDIIKIKKVGGIITTLNLLFLNFCIENRVIRISAAILLPVFLLLTFIINLFGLMLDKFDKTECFYSNIILVARKK